ncbi:MAG: hypothetical protein AAF570_09155, partial [Bacteroidota bacterium]
MRTVKLSLLLIFFGFLCSRVSAQCPVVQIWDAQNPSYTGFACLNDVQTFAQQNTAPGMVYTWSVANGVLISGQGTPQIDVLWNNLGPGQISLTITNGLGCMEYNYVSHYTNTITPPPVMGPDSVCAGDSAVYVYEWNGGPPSNIWVTADATGMIYYQVSDWSNFPIRRDTVYVDWGAVPSELDAELFITAFDPSPQCASSTTKPIFVAGRIKGPSDVCAGDTAWYTVNADSVQSWTAVNGNIVAGQGTDSVAVEWLVAGMGNISVGWHHPNCGTDTSSLDVTIASGGYVMPPISGADTLCSVASASYSIPAVPGHTYAWSVVGGTILSGTNSNQVSVQANSASMTLKLIEHFCNTSDSVTKMVVNTTPQMNLNGTTAVCPGDTGTYSTSLVAGYTYNWTAQGGTVFSGQGTSSVQVEWSTPGIGKVGVEVTGTAGCQGQDSMDVGVHALPVVSLGADTTACPNESTLLSIGN